VPGSATGRVSHPLEMIASVLRAAGAAPAVKRGYHSRADHQSRATENKIGQVVEAGGGDTRGRSQDPAHVLVHGSRMSETPREDRQDSAQAQHPDQNDQQIEHTGTTAFSGNNPAEQSRRSDRTRRHRLRYQIESAELTGE
jgi:hypothetical protein